LTGVEDSRRALAAATLTDQQQIDEQTRWLDKFDPPHEDKGVTAKRTAQLLFPAAENVLAVYGKVNWYPNAPDTSFIKLDTIAQSGAVIVAQSSIAFLRGGLPTDASDAGKPEGLIRIPYSDIASIGIKGSSSSWFWGFCAVTVTQTNGRVDWFGIPSREHPGLTDCPETKAAAAALQSAAHSPGH